MVILRVLSPRLGRAIVGASAGVAAIVAAIVLALTPIHASSAKFFRTANQAGFLKGDIDNLAVNNRGELELGPGTELVYETSAPFLWAMLAAPDGTLFLGTGNEGKVFKVDPRGEGSLFFDSPELGVHALATGPDGSIYAGTSPDGKIYKVDRNGTATELFDPDTKYIWALAVDSKGNVYAGTGEKGLIYKITPEGQGTPFYKTNTTHATALALDNAGNLFVGTGTPGKVLRVDPDGKPFVLLDSPFQEIRALRFDDNGMLYAVALSGAVPGGSAPIISDSVTVSGSAADSSRPVPTVTTEITAVSVAGTAVGTAFGAARDTRRSTRGAVYRIAPDGASDPIWESREESPYDLIFDQTAAVIIGTGSQGKIFRLEGDPPRPTLLARASAQQITAFHRDARGRLYYATANPGKLFRLSSTRGARGTYVSEARDAGTVSAWGTLSWRGTASGGNRIELFTRSGNTETPDATWSAWSPAYTQGDGSAIVSPKARYLQWRAVLTGTGDGPVLTSVTAAYLQRNLRPQVRSITVYPPGAVFQKPFSAGDPELAGFDNQSTLERRVAAAAAASQSTSATPALGRRSYQKGLQTLVWKADDENDDDLVYDVLYRREGETVWKPLRRASSDTILVWDTTTVPNGTYFVKVVASDSPANAPGTALTGELDGAPFEIDNTPPQIAFGSVRFDEGHTLVTFDVKDDDAPVERAEYSQDGLKWRSVFPLDGIADSREERYQLTIDGELGARGLTVRASDSMDNVATAHVDAPERR